MSEPRAAFEEGVATSRRERRKREVRDRIVAAAEALFAHQGFDGTTVDRIAQAADVAQKTFLSHFPAKHDLLAIPANVRLERLYGDLEQVRERPLSTCRKLEVFFESSARHIEGEDQLARDVNLELRRLLSSDTDTDTDTDTGGEEATRLHALFALLLREGQEAGDVRIDLEADFLAELGSAPWAR